MKYFGNNSNVIRDAELSMTNIVASNSVYRTDEEAKDGGGQVSLSGSYTGTFDATFDIEIVSDTIDGTPSISQPTFTGVGNGVISDISATPGLNAQTITVTLEDLGTQTKSAYAPFQNVTLIAKDSGPDGNNITIAVDASGLVKTATSYSLQDDLREGNNQYTGDQWNFGAANLNADGTIPDTAPRISFGNDPQVYRAYKEYKNGQYIYSFSPPPVRDVSKGALVKAVTGSRTVTITDGTTTDTLTDIVTLYDCLSAIRDDSTLVDVQGVIVNDKKPNGQGVTDLSVWTTSYARSITADGTEHIQSADIGLVVGVGAPTESLVITCTDAGTQGSELWSVTGDVSGTLSQAITGALYSDGDYEFTIPSVTIDNTQTTGTLTVSYSPDGTHPDGESIPSLCVYLPRIGIAAKNGTHRFIYSKRPTDPCDCSSGEIEGRPNSNCLGTTETGGGEMAGDASILRRQQRLATAVRDAIVSNTNNNYGNDAYYNAYDIQFIQAVNNYFSDCLRNLAKGTLELPVWQASHNYSEDEQIESVNRNGYRFIANNTGASGSTEPDFDAHTTPGDTVTDGDITWQCVDKTPLRLFDEAFEEFQQDLYKLYGTDAYSLYSFLTIIASQWTSSKSYAVGASASAIYTYPTSRNGHLYYFMPSANTTYTGGASQPTWPTTEGATVTDGGITWTCQEAYWEPNRSYKKYDQIYPGDGYVYTALNDGTSHSTTEPVWPGVNNGDSETVTDNDIVWRSGSSSNSNYNLDTIGSYLERYNVICRNILVAAGIDPQNFDNASITGNECWQDYNDSDYWWVYDGDAPYLPIQTGHYYHLAKKSYDEDGNEIVMSTMEGGFGPKFGCPENLKEGDTITMVFADFPNGGRTYQQGDRITASIVYADNLPFGGGQDGNDTLTWSVVGSDAGRLADYELVTSALAEYSDGGLGFALTPGGIDYQLGDQYAFDIEGGKFKWRKNAGSWSADTDIEATVSLSDGLSAAFVGGAAPSWVSGDSWSFNADAVNGPDNLRQPTDALTSWASSTTLEIEPDDTDVSELIIYDHTIASTATITLQGSNDNFSTIPLNVTIPWAKTSIYYAIDNAVSYAKYRIIVNQSGSVQWVYLGAPLEPLIENGNRELGTLVKRWKLPSLNIARRTMGANISHTWLKKDQVNAIMDMLDHACINDERRFAILPNENEPEEISLVEYQNDTLEIQDLKSFQPRDISYRLMSLSLDVEPVV